LNYYTQAADSYRQKDNPVLSSKMQVKVGECLAKLSKFDEARQKFEELAKQAVENATTRTIAKEYLFKAALCLLCSHDIGLNEAISKYSEIDNFFDSSKEKKFLLLLQDALNNFDADLVNTILTNNIDIYNSDSFKRELIKIIQDSLAKNNQLT